MKELKPLLSNTPVIDPLDAVIGTFLIEKNGCRACHLLEQPAAGPAYQKIARRYSGRPDAVEYLSNKIILGSSGNWEAGMAMPAHPTIPEEDVETLAKYILSLDRKDTLRWKTHGSYTLRAPENELHGKHVFRASYTDKGEIATPEITSSQVRVLRSPIIPVIAFDQFVDLEILHSILLEYSDISPKKSGAALVLENVDLTNIHAIQLSPPSEFRINTMANWTIEVRVDSLKGKTLGSTDKMIQEAGKKQTQGGNQSYIGLS